MYRKKNMIVFVLIFLVGLGLVAGSLVLDDHSYWAGFGGGLMGVGGMKLLQGIRYRKDRDFAREVDTDNRDERNMFLAEKARSWTCGVGFFALAAASVILRIMGLAAYSNICALVLCAMLVIYCVCYWILSRKY